MYSWQPDQKPGPRLLEPELFPEFRELLLPSGFRDADRKALFGGVSIN